MCGINTWCNGLVGELGMDKEYLNEYYKSSFEEMKLFNQELEIRKNLAERAIHERGNEVIKNIIQKNERNMQQDREQYLAEMGLVLQIKQAIQNGNDDLVAELVGKM